MVWLAQTGVFLRPTGLALLAFALVWGLRRAPRPVDDSATRPLRGPGAVAEEQLPDLAALLVLPNASLSPADVVKTQLAGLADAAGDGVGILQCYVFASPKNRSITGPLDHFGRMVREGPFVCLARPLATLVGRADIRGDAAKVLATVVDESGNFHAFAFILSKQTEKPFVDCWMTEGVYPVEDLNPESETTPESDPPAII
jgi:hypothetical protein